MQRNTWPDGARRALTQGEHEDWNAKNYPGTKQLCAICELPTGNCEEDSLYDKDEKVVCFKCYAEEQSINKFGQGVR